MKIFSIASANERNLLKTLFENYTTKERPVLNSFDVLEVNVSLNVFQIIDIVRNLSIENFPFK